MERTGISKEHALRLLQKNNQSIIDSIAALDNEQREQEPHQESRIHQKKHQRRQKTQNAYKKDFFSFIHYLMDAKCVATHHGESFPIPLLLLIIVGMLLMKFTLLAFIIALIVGVRFHIKFPPRNHPHFITSESEPDDDDDDFWD